MIISLTRLQLRHWTFLFAFHRWNAAVVKQLRQNAELIHAEVFLESLWGYWTVTAWPDENAMKSFRNSDAHRAAMPLVFEACDEASVARWESEDLPTPFEMIERMQAQGRVTPVKHPSRRHRDGQTVGTRRRLISRVVASK